MAKRKASRKKAGSKAKTSRAAAKGRKARRTKAVTARRKKKAGPARRKAAPARKKVAAKAKAPVATRAAPARKPAPALARPRRTLEEASTTPPSSLDMHAHGSAARSGAAGIQGRMAKHTETSPALTGGDVDADWEHAYSSGEEAPGGDNPTPDQDVVDDIGRALGVAYDDAEELKGAGKIEARDKHRWELDPASSDDYRNRIRK